MVIPFSEGVCFLPSIDLNISHGTEHSLLFLDEKPVRACLFIYVRMRTVSILVIYTHINKEKQFLRIKWEKRKKSFRTL